jgi:hypothetical protein
MVLVWQAYQSDLDRVYPMFALSINQTNDVTTAINPLDLLPNYVKDSLIEIGSPCAVAGLTPRKLALWLSDGAQFSLNYPVPFSAQLAQDLTATISIVAWEFVGERLKYGRLRKILDNAF